MSRRSVHLLANGETVEEVFLVADKQLRANRNGNLYLQVELRDKTGGIGARMWNASEATFRTFDVGHFVLVRGKVQVFQGALQMILSSISPVESQTIELGDFLPHTPHDIDHLLVRLRAVLRSVGNPHLQALAEAFLMDEGFMTQFAAAPAGIKNHHAYTGGLLEHVVTLLDAAHRLVDLYPDVDRDLLLMGIFLHDIGKVGELSYDRAFAYTDEGQLIGHLVMGVEMLSAKVAQAVELSGEPFPRALLLRLKHMILSHHGAYEYGSPKLPMTPEAIALHCLDNLDAKVHSFSREIRNDPNQASAWTAYNQALQRKLYKGIAAVETEPLVESTLGDE